MESDAKIHQKIATATSDPASPETPITGALDAASSTFPQQDNTNPRSPFDLRRGAKRRAKRRGNQNAAIKGGAWALNRKRQRGFPIDHRTREGKAELEITRMLVEEYGGEDRISTRQRILISLVGTDCGRLLQHKRSRRFLFQKLREAAKRKGIDPRQTMRLPPKQLAELDSYLSPVLASLRNNLMALGPEPTGKTADELAAYVAERYGDKGEDEQDDGKGDDDGGGAGGE
jgi:hypothetical protein